MGRDAFILDFNLLEEHGLSVDEFIALINITKNILNSQEILVSLQTKQFVKLIDDSVILREKSNILLELVSIDKYATKTVKKKTAIVSEEFSNFVEEFRALWRGLKPGSMGSASSCRSKMLRWVEDNPNYSNEQIMKAAANYIESVSNLYYLQQADNFIYKKEGHDEQSRLSAFIDEVNDKPVNDWTTNIV